MENFEKLSKLTHSLGNANFRQSTTIVKKAPYSISSKKYLREREMIGGGGLFPSRYQLLRFSSVPVIYINISSEINSLLSKNSQLSRLIEPFFPSRHFKKEKKLTPFEIRDSDPGERQATSWSTWLDYPFEPEQEFFSQHAKKPSILKRSDVTYEGRGEENVFNALPGPGQNGENREIPKARGDRFSDLDEGGFATSYVPSPEIEDSLSNRTLKSRPADIEKPKQEKILKGETIKVFKKAWDFPEIINESSDRGFEEPTSPYSFQKSIATYPLIDSSSFHKKSDGLKSLFKDDLTPAKKRRTRPERRKPENVKRRKAVWNILVEEYGEDLDPNQLTPTDVYEVLERHSILRKLYEPSKTEYYRRWSPKNPERASIKHRISSDLRYLPPE